MPEQKQVSIVADSGKESMSTGEQLTADGFWKMKESVFCNGVAPGGCSAVYILAGQTGLSELLKEKKGT